MEWSRWRIVFLQESVRPRSDRLRKARYEVQRGYPRPHDAVRVLEMRCTDVMTMNIRSARRIGARDCRGGLDTETAEGPRGAALDRSRPTLGTFLTFHGRECEGVFDNSSWMEAPYSTFNGSRLQRMGLAKVSHFEDTMHRLVSYHCHCIPIRLFDRQKGKTTVVFINQLQLTVVNERTPIHLQP